MEAFKTNDIGSWDWLKAMLKNRFAHLTEHDFAYEIGNGDEMFENLMRKLGKNKKEMAAIITHLYPH